MREVALLTRVGQRVYRRYQIGSNLGGWVAQNVEWIQQKDRQPTIGMDVVIHGPSRIGTNLVLQGQTSIPPYAKVGFGGEKSFVSLDNVILRGGLDPEAIVHRSYIGGDGHVILRNVDLAKNASITVEGSGEIRITHKPEKGSCKIAEGFRAHAKGGKKGGKIYLADLVKISPQDVSSCHIPCNFQCNVGPSGNILIKYVRLPSVNMTLGMKARPIEGNLYIIRSALHQDHSTAFEIGEGAYVGLIQSVLELPNKITASSERHEEKSTQQIPHGGLIFIKANGLNQPTRILNDIMVTPKGVLCYGMDLPWGRNIQGFKGGSLSPVYNQKDGAMLDPQPLPPGTLWIIHEEQVFLDGTMQTSKDQSYLRFSLIGLIVGTANTNTQQDHRRISNPQIPLATPPRSSSPGPSAYATLTPIPGSGRGKSK